MPSRTTLKWPLRSKTEQKRGRNILDQLLPVVLGVVAEAELGGGAVDHLAVDAVGQVGQEGVQQHLGRSVLGVNLFCVI